MKYQPTFILYSFLIAVTLLSINISCREDKSIPKNIVYDVDGNLYHTITIGTQVWMVENLKTKHYNDKIAIPKAATTQEWETISTNKTPGYCWYEDNDPATAQDQYGALYNWYAASNPNIAPKGWRVPTIEDWDILKEYLIANGYNYDPTNVIDNKIAKSMASTSGWQPNATVGAIGKDPDTNNSSGFTALPGGARDGIAGANFFNSGYSSLWWTNTEEVGDNAYLRVLGNNLQKLDAYADIKALGCSIRCVRIEPATL